ncbi:MAG TPA: hydroxymethylglutaryl-CoA lyase [Aquabacterium sp.]|nr:hydroxymethylglutaryl-CoA lyase [Aquabacterium sp.]HRH27662.1 hydroxymethylglutaryl-CoA lyase [Aquabacterium sp.]
MPVDRVTLVEVGPRDGLQNEKQPIDTALKIELIERLQASGLQHIEATSFVSPRWVPQMADAAQVMAGVTRLPGVTYSVLTPNAKGLEGALAARADEVLVFAAASEAFSQRNLNCSIDESLARFEPVVQGAKAAGLRVRGAISCAVGCPYQGDVSPDEVERVVKAYRALGVDQVSMADTIGVGTPRQVQAALERVLRHYPLHEVCGHYHDTYGQALANVLASLQMGVRVFDTSVAGLGGCPFAVGATGNVATEDVAYLLRGMDIDTGVDFDALVDAGQFISEKLGRANGSRAARGWLAQRARRQAQA